ncbi:MAG: type-F conjugative transfer system pilin assembly protein TrbC [Burkholderiales bacterium]
MWGTERSLCAAPGTVIHLVATCAVLACTASLAQRQPAVTDADIARASKVRPEITDRDMEAARKRHPMPTEQELSRVPVPAMPNIDALPVPRNQRQIDLGALARGFDDPTLPKSAAGLLALDRSLLVFVSFSMPEATLDRLVDQAAQVGATLVLRGLVDGSLQRTVQRAQTLISNRQVGFQIDPQAFDRFGVEVTPTFVLLKAGAPDGTCNSNACVPSSQFALASGDVSVGYALEFFKRTAPRFRGDAEAYLAKLKSRSP